MFLPRAVLLVAGICGAFGGGCGSPRAHTRSLPAWVFESSRTDNQGKGMMRRSPPRPPRPRGGLRGRSEAADFVVAALQGTGLRFGTDGSVAALWEYLRSAHAALPPAAARPGDVLFFQTDAVTSSAGCDEPDHVGIASTVDDDGRITFVEARAGQVRRSYADPQRPRVRRDDMGRILNTILRPKQPQPSETDAAVPNFAGEMLCATARLRG